MSTPGNGDAAGGGRASLRRRGRQTVKEVHQALRPIGWRRLVLAGAFLAAPLLLGGAALAGVSLWATSQPSFCENCHPMERFVNEWRVSSHEEVNCEYCHTKPGVFGFLGAKIAALQEAVIYFGGEYEEHEINAVVPNSSCLRCHKDVLDVVTDSERAGGLHVSHEGIVEGGGKCINCHSTIAHGSAVPAGSQTLPTMAACARCHDDQTAPMRCSLCHLSRPDGDAPAIQQAHPVKIEELVNRGRP